MCFAFCSGDIAFRFLHYINSQAPASQAWDEEKDDFNIQIPREVEAQIYMDPAESQDDISFSSSSSSDEDDERGRKRREGGESHVTVCDINQAMLDVGKQRAEQQGITSGNDNNDSDNITLIMMMIMIMIIIMI